MVKRAIVVAAALAIVACGGGTAAPPATINAQTKDQLAVDAAVLQQADLRGTWSANRPASTAAASLPTRDDVLTIADTCTPTPDGITATTAREYLSGPTLGHVLVRGVVEAHTDARALSATLATFTPDSVKACIPQIIHNVFRDTATLGDVAITTSTVDGVGADAGGFRATIHMSSGGVDFAIDADVVYARIDRYRATCTIINFDSEPDHSLCAEGLKAMIRRLEQ